MLIAIGIYQIHQSTFKKNHSAQQVTRNALPFFAENQLATLENLILPKTVW